MTSIWHKMYVNSLRTVHSAYLRLLDEDDSELFDGYLMMYDDCGNVIMPHTYFEDYKIMHDFLVYQGKKYYKFYNCHECLPDCEHSFLQRCGEAAKCYPTFE